MTDTRRVERFDCTDIEARHNFVRDAESGEVTETSTGLRFRIQQMRGVTLLQIATAEGKPAYSSQCSWQTIDIEAGDSRLTRNIAAVNTWQVAYPKEWEIAELRPTISKAVIVAFLCFRKTIAGPQLYIDGQKRDVEVFVELIIS